MPPRPSLPSPLTKNMKVFPTGRCYAIHISQGVGFPKKFRAKNVFLKTIADQDKQLVLCVLSCVDLISDTTILNDLVCVDQMDEIYREV